jgi:hypothetical protein
LFYKYILFHKKTRRCYYLATNVDAITQAIKQIGSGCVVLQQSIVFSITLIPSQNFSTPSSGALTNAPFVPLNPFLVFHTSTAAPF